jgi:hypothetical protein
MLSIQWDSFLREKVENTVQHMSYDNYFSRYTCTSLSNDIRNQLFELWVPHNYGRCSKWPPSISRQFAARQSPEPTLTYWHQLLSQLLPYYHEIFMYSFRCPHIKKSIGLIVQSPENHDVTEQSGFQVAYMGPWQCPWRVRPKRWHWNGTDNHICW